MRPLRTVVVGDALLPTPVIEEALGELAGWVEVVATLDWGPADEAEVDRLALGLEQGGPAIEPPPEALWGVLSDVELLLVHYCPVSKEVVDAAPRLAAVGTCRSGTENIDLDALFERRIPVIHTVGRTTEAVSDFTIGLLLAETRNIARAHRRMMDGRWEKGFANSPFTPELGGRTVGIVGMGEIGRAVARKLTGFRVRLLGHDPFVDPERMREDGVESADLDLLLREADFVSLHARPVPGAPPLIGARELARMKPTAILVNTARAALVDTDDLVDALRRRVIAGAALDVHDREPIETDHPLLALDNVTVTPHLASSTRDCTLKSPRLLVEDLRLLLSGGHPRHPLNPGSVDGWIERMKETTGG